MPVIFGYCDLGKGVKKVKPRTREEKDFIVIS